MKTNEKNEIDEKKEMLKEYSYPDIDKDFQFNIFRKEEYLQYYNERPKKILDNWEELVEARKVCSSKRFNPTKEQLFISNLITPQTPYKSLLLNCGTGTGKTLMMILICFNYYEQTRKYRTKPLIVVPGPNNKDSVYNEFLKFKPDFFGLDLSDDKSGIPLSDDEKKRRYNIAKLNVKQFVNIITSKSFNKKILGEKRKISIEVNGKTKRVPKKDEFGNIERDISINKITNLDNSLLLVDEGHNAVNTSEGKSIDILRTNSINLTLLIFTGTPVKNFPDEIVKLMNFIVPMNNPIIKEKVFVGNGLELQFKKDSEGREIGMEYFTERCNGYVFYIRGNDPILFPQRIDMGKIPKSLQFTKVVECELSGFQLETYLKSITFETNGLGRITSGAANFVFPGFDNNNKLIGFYGNNGINNIKNQIELNSSFNKDLQKYFPGINVSLRNHENKTKISGSIFNVKYLKTFSIKFHIVMEIIFDFYFVNKTGSGIAFLSTSLVYCGTDLLEEVFLANGILEYKIDRNYIIKPETICYLCGKRYDDHSDEDGEDGEDGKDGKDGKDKKKRQHKFYPATFISITGGTTKEDKEEDENNTIDEVKKELINNVVNQPNNNHGKFVKFIIGSSVINEGITIKHSDLEILIDAKWTLGSVIQILGRTVRFCSAFYLATKDNPMPKNYAYKLMVTYPADREDLKDNLTNEEKMYKDAETKYKVVSQAYLCLHRADVACPINKNINTNIADIEKYKNCVPISDLDKYNNTDKSKNDIQICPESCNFQKCEWKCYCERLNKEYYDEENKNYKKPSKSEIDSSTFDLSSYMSQIDYCRNIIIEMFKYKFVFQISQILHKVYEIFKKDKKESLFKKWYVYNALTSLIPKSNNDFNNFNYNIFDKYGNKGYLIYCGRYYIFQAINLEKNVPMYYRENNITSLQTNISLNDFLSVNLKNDNLKNEIKQYDFESTDYYYENRTDNDFVGTVDKPTNIKKIKEDNELSDVFKLRKYMPHNVSKKRAEGLPIRGSICGTFGNNEYLLNVSKSVGIESLIFKKKNNKNKKKKLISRFSICKLLKQRMFELEKYSTNNINYLIVPFNHPTIPFPLNLKDRVDLIIKTVIDLPNLNLPKNYSPTVNKIKLNEEDLDFDKNIDNNELEPKIEYCYYKIIWPSNINLNILNIPNNFKVEIDPKNSNIMILK